MFYAMKYCIIGTGFAGTCAFWHLIQKLTDPQKRPLIAPSAITIVTVEQGTVNGPGYPYVRDNVLLSHRCNNQANTMAIHGNKFIEWMVENKQRLIRDYPEFILETHPGIDLSSWQPDGDEFYPRAMFGLYLEESFQEALRRALAHGINVQNYVSHEVVDGYAQNERFDIRLRDLETNREFTLDGFDHALLSTGHWQTKVSAELSGRDDYIPSPYPPREVKAVIANKVRSTHIDRPCVFVQGMGPSGIDAIMSLCDEGEFVHTHDGHVKAYKPANFPGGSAPLRIIVGSRCGFFSLIRGPLADYEPHYLTEANVDAIRRENRGYVKIDRILELLELELRRATRGAVGWSDVESPRCSSAREKLASDLKESYSGNLVYTIVLKARRMRFYSNLEPRDKEVYDRTLDTHFIRTAVPMPPANAEKLLALMDAGVLTVVKLGYGARGPVAQEDGGFLITYQSEDGQQATTRVDCVIRATTQDFAMERHPSSLMQNLLRRGEVVAHQEAAYVTGGLALDGDGRFRVMRSVGGVRAPSPYLTSFGSPVRFWQNERNFAGAFVEAAERITSDWTEYAMAAADRAPSAEGAEAGENHVNPASRVERLQGVPILANGS